LDLHVGAIVGVTVSNGHLVVEPMPRPRYKLAELLAASDYSQPQTDDQLEWVVAPTAGREII
jgi:antitoxin ChpS